MSRQSIPLRKDGLKAGRSLEETILRRQMEANNGISLPKIPLLKESTMKARAASREATAKQEVQGKVVDALMDYCRHLEDQVSQSDKRVLHSSSVKSLRSQVTHNRSNDFSASAQRAESVSHMHTGHSGSHPSPHDASTTRKRQHAVRDPNELADLQFGIQNTISSLGVKVINLKQIFHESNPLLDRKLAAIKIQTIIRGWLTRIRLGHYKTGLKEWKVSRCRRVLWLLDILLSNQSSFNANYQQMLMNRGMKMLYAVFTKWLLVCRATAPIRRAVRLKAEALALAKQNKLVVEVFQGLKSACVGKNSRIQANKERRLLIDSIRAEMSAKLLAQGELGIISENNLKAVLIRRVLLQFLHKKALLRMGTILGGFKKIVAAARKNEAIANWHVFKSKVGKLFYAWSDWVYLVSVGLDRKRWSGPRKYEIRYNQKMVDNFSRLRRQRFCFGPWRDFYRVQAAIKLMFQRQTGRFVQINFKAWVKATKQQRRLRVMTAENWKAYPLLMTIKPFQAWANYVAGCKNFAKEQIRLVNAYIRWKKRQKILIILKAWRHQALFGRIDGMYTRRMLINSLGEQKLLSTSLEKMLSAQTLELESCHMLVVGEIEKRKELEEVLKNSEAEIVKQRMVSHHIEQEILRLETIVEAMAIINPTQVTHLRNMQMDFKFKTRHIVLAPPESFENSSSLINEDEDLTPAADGKAVADKNVVAKVAADKKEVEGPVATVATTAVKTPTPAVQPPATSHPPQTPTTAPLKSADHSQIMHSPELVPKVDPLSSDDRILLDRIKWVNSRFRSLLLSEQRAQAVAAMDAEAEAARLLEEKSKPMFADVSGRESPTMVGADGEKPVEAAAVVPDSMPAAEVDFKLFYDKSIELSEKTQEEHNSAAVTAAAVSKLAKEIPYGPLDDAVGNVRVQKPSSLFGDDPLATAAIPTNVTNALGATAASTLNTTDLSGAASLNPKRPDGTYQDDISRMLLSLLAFLESGDTTGLGPSDRRNWIQSVFQSSALAEHKPGIGDPTKDFKSANKSSMTSKSWRKAVVYLRAMYPSSSSLAPQPGGLYVRIADMREHADRVAESQSVKHSKKLRLERRAEAIAKRRTEKREARKRANLYKNRALGIPEDEESDEEHSEDDITESEESEEEVSINVFAGNLSTILQKPVPTVGSQSIIPGQNKNTDLD